MPTPVLDVPRGIPMSAMNAARPAHRRAGTRPFGQGVVYKGNDTLTPTPEEQADAAAYVAGCAGALACPDCGRSCKNHRALLAHRRVHKAKK